jgi:hypothetical protein
MPQPGKRDRSPDLELEEAGVGSDLEQIPRHREKARWIQVVDAFGRDARDPRSVRPIDRSDAAALRAAFDVGEED